MTRVNIIATEGIPAAVQLEIGDLKFPASGAKLENSLPLYGFPYLWVKNENHHRNT